MKFKKIKLLTILLLLAISFSFCKEKAEPEVEEPCACDEPEPCDYLCDDYEALLDIEYWMYVNNEKRYFTVVPNKIMFHYFNGKTDRSRIWGFLDSMCVKFVMPIYVITDEFMLVNLENFPVENVMCLIEQWKVLENNIYISPIISGKDGIEGCFVPHQIVVRIKQESDYSLLLEKLQEYNVKTVEAADSILLPLVYIVTINDANRQNSMQIANELHESGLFVYSEPNIIQFIRRD